VLDDAWDCLRFPDPLRRSPSAALDEVERLRSAGRRAVCVVLPPGAGWTELGLEVARRRRRRTLVLTPNTAVQGQWLRAWQARGGQVPPPGDTPGVLTVVTTLALSAWDRGADDEPVADDSSPLLAQQRRAAVRGQPGADLLSLLHPSGRALVDRAARRGPWTLVLVESAHLLETWGPLVGALARALGDDTDVLGVTATPPHAMGERSRALHEAVFGDADVVVPAPTAVVRGDVAPYQELVLVTAPTAEEDATLEGERARFAALSHELLAQRAGTVPFPDWLERRLHERRSGGGGERRSWRALAQDEPGLARAALRLVHAGVLALPPGARLAEEHRVPADADDWGVLLGAYVQEHLAHSSAADDVRLRTAVTSALPGLGWSLTDRGLRPASSPVDRVCARSAAKVAGAADVMRAELAARGEDLRALVVCDGEHGAAGSSRLRPDAPAPGSADAAFLALAGSDLAPALRPVLCTGRTLALRREDLAALRAFAPHRIADRLVAEPFAGQRSVVRLTAGQGWDARTWVPLVTDWLAAGGTRTLVGTRGLLGLGWDCPPLDVVVDLTTVSTAPALRSVHGRVLGVDPARPQEVADVWTVVCVADGHPRGGVDHLRGARGAEHLLAPAPDGTVTAGIGHADEALSPLAAPGPELRAAVAERALARVAQRDAVRRAWAEQPEDGSERVALRVRASGSLGLPGGVVPAPLLTARSTLGSTAPAPLPRAPQRGRLWPLPVGAAVVTSAGSTLALTPGAGAGAGLATGLLLGGTVAGRRWRAQSSALARLPDDPQSAALRQLAQAVADALHASGATGTGEDGIDVMRSGDELVCVLDGTREDSRLFAASLDELLAPLAEPRWLVSRFVLPVPAGAAERRALVLARAFGRPVEAPVAWHAVPAALTRSRAGVDAFEAAWQRHVGAGRLVLARDPEGVSLLELLQGEDPFAVTTRTRTVWR
jgi:hypothetical protein